MNFNKKSNPKRRQLYINRSFQTRFMMKFVLILILGGAITIALTFFNTKGTLTSSFVDSKLVIQNTSLAILPSIIYTNLITTAVLGIISVMVTLLVSHKIAGPMYRFEKDIDRVSKGDLKSKINIREGDQFQEIVNSLNIMIGNLNKEIGSIKRDVDALAKKADMPEDLQLEIIRLKDKIESSFRL